MTSPNWSCGGSPMHQILMNHNQFTSGTHRTASPGLVATSCSSVWLQFFLVLAARLLNTTLKPCKSCHHHCLHLWAHKFSFFFHFISNQCYRDPLYPTHWVLKPPPLHHIILTPMPHPSGLTSPCHHLCLTACKPGCLHLHHMQVCHHPITACKIHPQC